MESAATLEHLGVTLREYAGADLTVRSPIDGSPMAALRCRTCAEVEASIAQAVEAFQVWRDVPAPRRGIPTTIALRRSPAPPAPL